MKLVTRLQYMTGRGPGGYVPFRKYWAQFVNDELKERVKNHIGLKKILKSEYPFGNIAVHNWDKIELPAEMHMRLKKANGGFVSKSDIVCASKEAARQLRDKELENHE